MEQIYNYIEKGKAKLCDSLKELVRIPTVNPPGTNYAEIVQLLQERCETLGMSTKIVPVPQAEAQSVVPHADDYPRMNLIARWDVGAEKTVHFNAHYDVVPVSGDWRFDPFKPEIVGDWLYGRGADDMKDSIAALLFAIAALQENGAQPAFNIECSLTCDEETGGELGAGYVARNGLVQADYVVNCEGGSVLNVGVGHNGVLWLEVKVHGKAAHAANPDKGLNAFEKAAALVTEIQPLKQGLKASDRVFKTFSGDDRYPTLNIGGIFHGTEGDKVNTVPAQTTFSIDRRILPNERLSTAEAELRGAIQEVCQSDAELKVCLLRMPDMENTGFRNASRVVVIGNQKSSVGSSSCEPAPGNSWKVTVPRNPRQVIVPGNSGRVPVSGNPEPGAQCYNRYRQPTGQNGFSAD